MLYPSEGGFRVQSLFALMLSSRYKTADYVLLSEIFSKEFLLFLSVFEGKQFKVPPLSRLREYQKRANIYSYLKSRYFSKRAYKKASRKFKRREVDLKAIVQKVRKQKEDFLTNIGGSPWQVEAAIRKYKKNIDFDLFEDQMETPEEVPYLDEEELDILPDDIFSVDEEDREFSPELPELPETSTED